MTTQQHTPQNRHSKIIWSVLAAWFVVACAVGASGVMSRPKAPIFGLILWALVGLIMLAYWRSTAVREWVQSLDLRVMVLYHAVRFVGFYFLALYAQGRLPYDFAVPGGWGDNFAAAGALLVGFLCLPIKSKAAWRAVLIWNVFGLIDILLVAATALKLALSPLAATAELMKGELTHLPLSLLPTFIVPLIVTTHIFIFIRLAKLQRV